MLRDSRTLSRMDCHSPRSLEADEAPAAGVFAGVSSKAEPFTPAVGRTGVAGELLFIRVLAAQGQLTYGHHPAEPPRAKE